MKIKLAELLGIEVVPEAPVLPTDRYVFVTESGREIVTQQYSDRLEEWDATTIERLLVDNKEWYELAKEGWGFLSIYGRLLPFEV